MGERGLVGRLVVGVSIALLLSGCAGSAVSSAPSTGAPSAPVATSPAATPAAGSPSASAVAPPPTIDLSGFSVRPFGLAVTTSAYFAVDAAGNVYLPGGSAGAALVKIAPDGSVLAKWPGFDVVPGQPDTVVGIAIDPASGDVWITDTTADAVVRLAPDLTEKVRWGSTGPGKGQFFSPGGIALDPQGNIVVADMGNDRIETFTPDGKVVAVWDAPGGKTAPVDVTTDQKGNVYASGVQPNMFAVTGGKVVRLSSTGGVELVLPDAAGLDALTFPSTAVDAAGTIYIADAFLGLLAFTPDGKHSGTWPIPSGGQAAVAVRIAPSGNIYTLACLGANGDCTLAENTPAMQQIATWHASTPVDRPGTMVDVGGHSLYLQCVGSGSPTIVWEAGAQSSGWLNAAQYLMGKLAETSRVCVYDRPGLGWSDPGPYDELSHWSQVVTDLHTALAKAGEKGPYMMAGHSYGGLLARLSALTYPKEVAGVVAVDPSPEDETCTNAPCPLSPDVQAMRKLEGGKIAGSLGDLPLVVISHSPDLPFWDPASHDAIWEQLGAEAATASSNARRVIASWSTHLIPYSQPGLVIEAVRQVVAAARASDHALPACGAAFTELGGLCQ
jgi:pimeloyl-ACP methyl ester carboxylesterase/streptogramin lyase